MCCYQSALFGIFNLCSKALSHSTAKHYSAIEYTALDLSHTNNNIVCHKRNVSESAHSVYNITSTGVKSGQNSSRVIYHNQSFFYTICEFNKCIKEFNQFDRPLSLQAKCVYKSEKNYFLWHFQMQRSYCRKSEQHKNNRPRNLIMYYNKQYNSYKSNLLESYIDFSVSQSNNIRLER